MKEKKRQSESRFSQRVGRKEERKIKSRRRQKHSLWFGLGMFGLVGWSVAVPTLIGVAAGWWIDHRWPSRFSWTLMLLFLGLGVGCLIAWHWIKRESRDD